MNNGFIVPPVHIRDNLQLEPNQYHLIRQGAISRPGRDACPDTEMAMDPGMVTEKIRGIATKEPAFGLPALWITEDKKERAQIAGYTVVDCTTVMATHISEIIKTTPSRTARPPGSPGSLLDNLPEDQPKLVEELVPKLISLSALVKRVLQNLLAENVSIRDLRTILETLADYGPRNQDTDILTE